MNLKTYFSDAFGRVRNALRRARLSAAEIAFLGAAIIFASGVALDRKSTRLNSSH